MHWRDDEILQDGDEFELDRGVLIQVGEAMGSMEQDLTGLFEKRKKAPEVVVNSEEILHQPVAVPTARPTAAQPSQLRPKTLNALLGTPKGRIGRAALPTKSPHELRTASENSSWDQDRPAKRQRVESQLERIAKPNKMPPPRAPENYRVRDEGMSRTVVGAVSDKQADERLGPPTMRNSRLSSAGHAVTRPPFAPIQSGENQKEGEISKRVVELLPEKRSSKSRSSDPTAQQRKRKPDQDAQVSRKAQKTAKRPEHEPETAYARTSALTEPIEIVSEEDAASINERPKQRLQLQLASRKPRKKLMYRDLLPQESSATRRSSGDASVLDRSSRAQSTSSRPDKRKRDPMAEFHEEEQERLKAQLDRHSAKETHRKNEREQYCGDAPDDLFLSQEHTNSIPADDCRTEEKEPKRNAPKFSMTDSRRRNTEPAPSSNRPSLPQEAPQHVIPRPPSTVHSTAMTLAKMDEILFSRAQPRNFDSVEEKDALTEVLPKNPSPPPIPRTPPAVISTTRSLKDRPNSSPAFQTQAEVLPTKFLHPEDPVGISRVSRLDIDLPCAFAKIVQPKMQEPKQRTSKIPVSDSDLSSLPANLPKTISSPSPPSASPVLGRDLPNHPDHHLARSPAPEPPITATIPPITIVKPNTLSTFSKIVAPKPPTAPESVPRHKPSNQPAFTKVIPTIPMPKTPDETVEVLSSQPSSSPPPETPVIAPHPPKRKPDSLPAFTKVVPTKPESPLKKSVSDTSAMRPPSALPASNSNVREKALPDDPGRKDESAVLWSKEAWDLFGCGRDGVECTYEEFKRKEGLA